MHASNKLGYKTFIIILMMNMQNKETKKKYNRTFLLQEKVVEKVNILLKQVLKEENAPLVWYL